MAARVLLDTDVEVQMHSKKLTIALTMAGLAILAAVLIVLVPSTDESQAGDATGIVNSEADKGATLEAAPRLSTERFELPPSVGTGSYTEPAPGRDTQTK